MYKTLNITNNEFLDDNDLATPPINEGLHTGSNSVLLISSNTLPFPPPKRKTITTFLNPTIKKIYFRILLIRLVTYKKSKIVRVQYFVRGGFVGHRSRASSKHLSPHLPVDELDSSGVKKGLRCSCKMHVWVSGPQRSRLDVDVSEK
ncbi:hypothetical protein TNCV_4825821 [Trichonephila clavipes]|uniref:Uncharacterized protein n=1 Tax=Trichonephila clavipes TaxID=2585209 RepID=A0A8X6V5C2_TRICX|nr:hypothetical protein TNCV_4825821 [Trichonephila clavipes]